MFNMVCKVEHKGNLSPPDSHSHLLRVQLYLCSLRLRYKLLPPIREIINVNIIWNLISQQRVKVQ